MIEVVPDGQGWAVKRGATVLATLPGQTQAVAFARNHAERVAARGGRPRIVVEFRRGWRA